ncbi:MAG: PLDc N-terminal domain-containing protein [Promicromonosporaceae bacterium]|nr:PLDc N-terminal domain-containing protein [Promicromonosporaceae bacterium]
MNFDLISPTVWVVVGIAAVIQIGLMITALIALARTPNNRLVFDAKWPWVLIIVLINIVGPIIFFAIARKPAPTFEPTTVPHAADLNRTVNSLYGTDQR